MEINALEDMQDRRVKLSEALQLLGVSSNTWYTWRHEGRIKIPIYKEGTAVFLRLSDINLVISGRATLLYTMEELKMRLGATKRNRKKDAS